MSLVINPSGHKLSLGSLNKGLTLHYEADAKYFNPTTKRITDRAGYGNHGISENALSLSTDWMGQANKAISFNGENDHIGIPHDNSLNLVDGFSASVRVKPTDVLGSPQGIFTKGNYALKEYDDEYIFQVIGPATTWGNQLSVGTNPLGLCVYNGKLYCTCWGSNNVYVYDGISWTNSGSVGNHPQGLCVYNDKLYCTCSGSNNVYVYDGISWTNSGSVGSTPIGLCAYNGKLYCSCYGSNNVYVYDGTWTNSGSVGTTPRGLGVYNGKLYCACHGSNNVYVYDGISWTNSGSVGTGTRGLGVYNDKLYCACQGSNNVYVYDGISWTNSGSVGSTPIGLCAYNGKLYCSCYGSNNVYVYDGTWTNSGSVGIRPYGLSVYDGKLYCACFNSNNVYELGTGKAIRISKTSNWDLVHVDYTASNMSIALNDDVANKVTAAHSLSLDNNSLDLRVGASYGSSQSGFTGGNDEHLKGLFGEIRIYNRTLSAADQTLLYDSYRPKYVI